MKLEKQHVGNFFKLRVRLVSIEPYKVEIEGRIQSDPLRDKFIVMVPSDNLIIDE
jgi:hypothetical protein